jgi:hypothetical protein
MTAMVSLSKPLAVAQSWTLTVVAAAAILTLLTIRIPPSENSAVAQLAKSKTSSRAGGTPSNSSDWLRAPTLTRSQGN